MDLLKKNCLLYANVFIQMALLVPYGVVELATAHLELFNA